MVAKIGSDFSIDEKLIVKGPGVIDRFFPQGQRDLEYIHKNTGFFVRGGEILFGILGFRCRVD
ncbi:hypothetical protein BJF83_20485 [Nocardiopsis sp. CNR-923]|nr:hypothetical protein BJF83_20485 [Nocardiopsis sp. CNR-923]